MFQLWYSFLFSSKKTFCACVFVPQTSVLPYTGQEQTCGPPHTTEQLAAVHGTLDWHCKNTKQTD